MANAKKCDRCGKYYDKNTMNEARKRDLGRKICGIATLSWSDHYIDEVFDLCDDCISDLFKFMEGDKNE